MGIYIHMNPYKTFDIINNSNITNANLLNLHNYSLSFFSSYTYWNKIRNCLIISLIEYVRCCADDTQFNQLNFTHFLNNFKQIKHQIFVEKNQLNVLIDNLKNHYLLLDSLNLTGIYDFLNISGSKNTIISYKNSMLILNTLKKLQEFVYDNDDIKKNIIKLKELFLQSIDLQKDIYID